MKKFMLRGKRKKRYLPKTLNYGVWYTLITPFDWQYFKLKKGSRFVSVYDFISDKKPQFTFTRKRFVKEILPVVKSRPRPAKDEM